MGLSEWLVVVVAILSFLLAWQSSKTRQHSAEMGRHVARLVEQNKRLRALLNAKEGDR